MKDRLISVICPVYNSETFLKECVLSVVEQSDDNWELILVDDGSSDESGLICNEFSNKDKRIKSIHKRNEGQMKARIEGIKRSSGDYIMFLDSDDMLCNDAIKIVREYLAFSECDSILFNGEVFPNNCTDKVLPRVRQQVVFENNYDIFEYTFGCQMFGYLWMYCFKKEKLLDAIEKQNSFLDVRYTEDGAFIFNAISSIQSLCTINVCLYKYRSNENSITHNLLNKDRKDRFLVFDFIYSSIFEKYHQFNLSNNNAEMISWALFSLLEHTDNKKDFKNSFKEVRSSTIFKRICKKTKANNRRFEIYKLLLMFNLPNIFYNFTHK